LEQLKEELSKATVASQGELLTLQDKIDRTEENIADKKDEIASIQLQIQRLEAEYKKEKQVHFLPLQFSDFPKVLFKAGVADFFFFWFVETKG
jgi:hypothetical protein